MALQLHDIHLPKHDMLWWPLAPGWYLLCFLLITAIALCIFWRKRQPKKKQIKAEHALQHIYKDYQQHQNQHQFMQELSILIRRICLRHFAAKDFASLQGQAWLTWLDQSTHSQVCFSKGIGTSLVDAPYNRQQHVDVKQLYQLCQQWLHLVEKASC